MRPNGSPNTVAASSKDTSCLTRFVAAFRVSHSNSSFNRYYNRANGLVGKTLGPPGLI